MTGHSRHLRNAVLYRQYVKICYNETRNILFRKIRPAKKEIIIYGK